MIYVVTTISICTALELVGILLSDVYVAAVGAYHTIDVGSTTQDCFLK